MTGSLENHNVVEHDSETLDLVVSGNTLMEIDR